MADGKTAFENRLGNKFDGPSVFFGTTVEYIPITARDKSRIHQFGKKTLRGVFLGYVLRAGGGGQATSWWQITRIDKSQKSQRYSSRYPKTN